MMLVPLGHERDVVRRWPVITVGIMGLCLLIHSWVYYEDRAVDRAFAAAAVELVQYAEDHPELQEPPGYAKIARLVTPRRPSQARAPRYRASDTGDQATLDGLVAKAEATLLQHPYFRFGYVPERRNWLGLVTSAFIHGGYLHLIFNMWFLWLAGTSLEDRWGRGWFTGFYLLGAAASGLAHATLVSGGLDRPLIGASGAVAACMGAFLVLFARTRLQMLFLTWIFLRPITKRFAAPAYVMLPLWAGSELLYAVAFDQSGTAHWAHVGGFAFGAATAGALVVSGLDGRLDAAVDAETSSVQDSRLLRAMELSDQGKGKEALLILRSFSQMRPKLTEVQLELLRAARLAGDNAMVATAYGRLVALYLERNEPDNAMQLAHEAAREGRLAELPVDVRVRLADCMVAAHREREAMMVYDSVTKEPLTTEAHLAACVASARVLPNLGSFQEALELLDAVLESPIASQEVDQAARTLRDELSVRYAARLG